MMLMMMSLKEKQRETTRSGKSQVTCSTAKFSTFSEGHLGEQKMKAIEYG